MNKTALITGASKRIGKAVAGHLAAAGWNVAIHYSSSGKDAEELVAGFRQKYPGQEFGAVRADLSKIAETERLISETVKRFGVFCLLINNASVFNRGKITETTTSLFDSQVNINLRAPFILIRDFANLCKEGNIINFADTRITTNKPDYAAYSLSKKALWELTKMAALELAPAIRVNAIAPGLTLPPEGKDENYLLRLAENIPMEKPPGLEPVLKSIDYILGNGHLTGQLLFADGGENLGKNN